MSKKKIEHLRKVWADDRGNDRWHNNIQASLRKEWPELYTAIRSLVREKKDGKKTDPGTKKASR